MKIIFFISLFLLLSTISHTTIINIPDDYPSIQAGIDAAVDTDTVLVQPGTYVENINYNGKLITVASLFLTTQDTTYISQTIIDGNNSGSVVLFESEEDSTAVLLGFTLMQGSGYGPDPGGQSGGGISCYESSPSLLNLLITDNGVPGVGGGIFCHESSPSLVNVTISDNSAGSGGGICCESNYSPSSPSLVNVTISGNDANVNGGGIWCYYSSPNLTNVIITGNSANVNGGGIWCRNNSNPSLINSILWNDSPQEIYFHEDSNPNSITNSYSDILGGEEGIVTNNNGTVNWQEGNIEEDPLFVETGEHPFSLLQDSPCIDAGTPNTDDLNLPPWDIIGNERIWDGDGDGIAVIDMGAYEYGAPIVDLEESNIADVPELILYQNYPNPFNPETVISFQLSPENDLQDVELVIYNIKGQKIKDLANSLIHQSSNQYSIIWDGTDDHNQLVSTGIYFYKLKTKKDIQIKKMILIK
jgi:predicted outer membrane repeat protein